MRRYLRLWGVIATLAVLLAGPLVFHPLVGVAQDKLPIKSVTSPTASGNTITHGVHIPPIYYNNTEVHAYNQLVGKDAGIVMVFYSWGFQMPDVQCGFIDMTLRRPPRPAPYDCGPHPTGPEIDTTLLLTWEPNSNPESPYDCPLIQGGRANLDVVINGECDPYLDAFARQLLALHQRYGDRFMLRLAHEMNLSDNVWFENDPSYPATYVNFWRHVVDRFRAVGVSREVVQFVWSPNHASRPTAEWNAIPNYYPGDDYVEWVGLSGYNWFGTHGNDPEWRTFDEIFNAPDPTLEGKGVLEFLQCAYAKPIVLAEVGTVDGGSPERSKAQWIRDAMAEVRAYPFVKSFVWFNDYAFGQPGNADFRLSAGSSDDPDPLHYPGWHHSLGAVTDAWREAIADPAIIEEVPPLTEITPTNTLCHPPAELVTTNFVMAEPGETIGISLTGVGLSEGSYLLRVEGLPTGIEAEFIPPTISQSNPNSTLRMTIPETVPLNTYSLQVFGEGNGTQAQSQLIQLQMMEEVWRGYLPLIRR
jgi:hypothetical protein